MFTRYILPIRDSSTLLALDYSRIPFEADVSGDALYSDSVPNGFKVAFNDPSNEQVRIFPGEIVRPAGGFTRFYLFGKAPYYDWNGVSLEFLVMSGGATVVPFDTRPRYLQGYSVGLGPGSSGGGTIPATARTPSTLVSSAAISDAALHVVRQRSANVSSFRILGYQFEVSGNATVAGGAIVTLGLYDWNGVSLHNVVHDFYLPAAVPAAAQRQVSGWIPTGPVGLLVPAIGDGVHFATIQAQASAALASGSWRVQLALSEE